MSHRLIVISIGLVLLAASSALAQNGPPPAGTAGPATREGNIYDYRDHQPTQAEIDRALGARGNAPAPSVDRQVEEDVQKLLRQGDQLDQRIDEEERGGNGSSSTPTGR